MSVTNYGQLKTAVATWLAKDNLTSYIPDFITLAQNTINDEVRVTEMETALSSVISSGVIATPTGYLDMLFAYIDGSSTQYIERKNLEFVYSKYPTRSSSGKPLFFARQGSNIVFAPYPDSNYTVKGVYFKAFTAFSADGDTNSLLTSNFGLYLFAALVEAEPFIQNDERLSLWQAKYEQIRDRIKKKYDMEKVSGSSISSAVY